uniref:Uncharacterized protein n=1 Tax=Aegilops tauschii TaxID=37682 RepID=M8CPK6_AEGTA
MTCCRRLVCPLSSPLSLSIPHPTQSPTPSLLPIPPPMPPSPRNDGGRDADALTRLLPPPARLVAGRFGGASFRAPPRSGCGDHQRQLKEGAGHGDAAGAASSTHTHRRPSEGTSLLGLANYADEEEDEHGGPRGRANGRPREKEEEDERRALERQPMQVELRRDCSYLDTVNRLRPLEKRQFGVFRDCMYGGIEGVPLHANCRRMAKLQLIGRLTTWLSKQQNQFSGGLGSTSLLIGQILNLDSTILVHIPLLCRRE